MYVCVPVCHIVSGSTKFLLYVSMYRWLFALIRYLVRKYLSIRVCPCYQLISYAHCVLFVEAISRRTLNWKNKSQSYASRIDLIHFNFCGNIRFWRASFAGYEQSRATHVILFMVGDDKHGFHNVL